MKWEASVELTAAAATVVGVDSTSATESTQSSTYKLHLPTLYSVHTMPNDRAQYCKHVCCKQRQLYTRLFLILKLKITSES